MGRSRSGRRWKPAVLAACSSLVVLAVGASEARPAHSDQVTISMVANITGEAGYTLLIPNFERVYPNVKVDITYTPNQNVLFQLEATELAAGNAPDVLTTYPGCGTPISICELAKAGDLAPMIGKPWVRWSLPLVTSDSKVGQGLFAFEPTVLPFALFTNDGLFRKLGLTIPQKFSQLLEVCQKAKAAGTTTVILAAGPGSGAMALTTGLAVEDLYASNRQWAGALRAGKASFEGTAGWHQALQQFVQMNDAGCFQPGAAGTSSTTADALFAQGQGLTLAMNTSAKGIIDADGPQFSYTAHPFPAGPGAEHWANYIRLGISLSVNAHASAQEQAAAQTFVDFIARPKQNALFAQAVGGLTQYEFKQGQFPVFMASLAPAFQRREYVVDPSQSWWNPGVLLAFVQDATGLITGQDSTDDVLNAMDAAWKQGPG
jgi:raffinose/stachyose/melibiose transport system substrate-binding protein